MAGEWGSAHTSRWDLSWIAFFHYPPGNYLRASESSTMSIADLFAESQGFSDLRTTRTPAVRGTDERS